MSIQEKQPAEGVPTQAPVDIPQDDAAANLPAISAAKPKRRRGKRLVLMALLPALLVGGGIYMYLSGGRYEETENANLQLSKVAISSEVSGRVTLSNVADDMHVEKGDILFQVDPEPLEIALEQADAAIATARLNVGQMRAAYQQALANEKAAQSDVDYTADNLRRYQTLADKGVAPASSFDEARHAARQAQQQLAAAKQEVANARAALGPALEGEIDDHPSVKVAIAKHDQAAYDLRAATVRAPADGVLYEASDFRPGRYVSPGAQLFTLVETSNPWVEANFKETQLTHMKAGQSAEVTFDVMPDRHFEATVQSIGAGTGAEFSLLPAQNATGNWVKVTQRLPVRLTLDDPDADILLRSGLSATVSVDTGYERHLGDVFSTAQAGE